MRRKICLITGSRAEYGHLRWIARTIAQDSRCTLQLLVTGMHLEARFGETWQEIRDDGHVIDATVPMDESDDNPTGVARSMGRGLAGMAEALERLAPDIAVILGDRFEMMAAAQAAMLTRTPIAHIHGGETTEGAMDEAVRHSITKMAHLHFTAAGPYARRVAQIGEDPTRIYAFGAPGLDAIQMGDMPSPAQLSREIGFDCTRPFFLVTYHPVTLSDGDPDAEVTEVLAALGDCPNYGILITGVNADTGNTAVERAYQRFASAVPDRTQIVAHLGQRRYIAALAACAACVGNSSSGLIEAPALGVPSVNVGPRQQGRLRGATVIDCAPRRDSVGAAVARALDPAFREATTGSPAPYGQGGVSRRIVEVLATVNLHGILTKHFHDVSMSREDLDWDQSHSDEIS